MSYGVMYEHSAKARNTGLKFARLNWGKKVMLHTSVHQSTFSNQICYSNLIKAHQYSPDEANQLTFSFLNS